MKKKFINILLICSVLVSLFVVPQYTTSAKTISNISQKTELLQNIINLPGEAATGVQNVKRIAYVDALARLMGQNFEVSQTIINTKFYDVYGKDTATQAVEYLAQRDIIHGNSEGMFCPDENITFDDAVRLLLYAIGYEKLIEDDNLFNIASNIGLLKNISYRSGDLLTGEKLIELFYNALDVNIISIDGFEGTTPVYSSKEETILTGILDMFKTKGVIEQTPYTSLYQPEGCVKGTVTVGEYNYICDDISIIDYIGYNVEVYCKKVDDGIQIMHWIIDDNNDNIEIDIADVLDFEDYTIEYKKDDGKKIQRVKLDKAVRVIYNGKLADSFNKDMLMSDLGNIKLIKSEGGNYDVMVIEQFKNYRVSGIDKKNEKIYSFDTKEVLDLSDTSIDYFMMNEKMMDIELGDITANQIMSVAKSSDGQYIKIIASSIIVSGEVTGIRKNNNDRTCIMIDGEEYELADNVNFVMPKNGQGIKAFLDFKKRIFAYVPYSYTDNWNTGYLIKIYKDDSEVTYSARILKNDNLIEDISISSKVRINDEAYKNDALTVCDELFNGDVTNRQLIRYKQNAANEITKIETAKENGNSKSQLRKTAKSNEIYRSSASTFGYKTFIGNNTMVFIVPEESSAITVGTKRNAYISDSSYFYDFGIYPIEAYTVGDDMTEAHAIVVTKDENFSSSKIVDWAWTSVITDIYERVNEDDECETVIKVKQQSSESEYIVTQVALNNIWVGNNYTGPYELGRGDAVRISSNTSGEIDMIELLYDADKQKYTAPRSSYINPSFDASISYAYGMATKRAKDSEGRIYVDYGFEGVNEYLVIIPVDSFRTTVVDMSEKKINVDQGYAGDVKTRDVFGTLQASKVIISTERGMPREIIIYNY